MRLNHNGNFKVYRFQLFNKSKKMIVPLGLLHPTFPYNPADEIESAIQEDLSR